MSSTEFRSQCSRCATDLSEGQAAGRSAATTGSVVRLCRTCARESASRHVSQALRSDAHARRILMTAVADSEGNPAVRSALTELQRKYAAAAEDPGSRPKLLASARATATANEVAVYHGRYEEARDLAILERVLLEALIVVDRYAVAYADRHESPADEGLPARSGAVIAAESNGPVLIPRQVITRSTALLGPAYPGSGHHGHPARRRDCKPNPTAHGVTAAAGDREPGEAGRPGGGACGRASHTAP